MIRLLLTLSLLLGSVNSKLADSVKVNGIKRKLTSGCHNLMCRAVVDEMRGEIKKHDLTKEGEGEVFDTAGQAICIGVVQNYMMYERKGDRWSIRKRNDYELTDDYQPDFNALLILKESCFHFCDEAQWELSEYTYKHIHDNENDNDFCEELTKPKPKKKKKPSDRKQPVKESKDEQQYEDMMNKIGQDLNIQDLMQTDRYSPELLLDEADQEYIKTTTKKMTCKVCTTAVKKGYNDTTSISDEAKLSIAMETAFFGNSDPDSMDYIPASPPGWALSYVISPKFELLKLDPEADPLEYNENIIRNVIIAKAAQKAHEDANIDIAEHIIQTAKAKGRKPTTREIADVVCKKSCKTSQYRTEEL